MSQLVDLIASQLGPGTIQQMGQAIGADPKQTQTAVSAALPMIIGGLANNANRSPEGAQSLAGALDKDHAGGALLGSLASALGGGGGGGSGGAGDLIGGLASMMGGGQSGGAGDLLGGLAGMLGGGESATRATNGEGILGHVLGNRRGAVEQGIGQASGLDGAQVGKLLATLAPVVMAALGKAKADNNLDAGGVASMLSNERDAFKNEGPNPGTDMLSAIFDRDGDGGVADDVASIGMELAGKGLLSGLFGK